MKNHIVIEKNTDCYGCKNCVNSCPCNAIYMKKNNEGFLYPKIDEKKCINCGKCKLVCPFLNAINTSLECPICYAITNKDDDILKKSTSGGFFYALAKYVIENNGFVYGAVFDENLKLKHIGVNNLTDLEKIMGSKYLYSDLDNIFNDIKDKLNQEKLVLFTGVPCQISALNSFLKKKYDNLITMDVICHGTPNQDLFDKYIEYLEKKYNSKIIDYKFRSKEKSHWGAYKAEIRLANGKIKYINADFDKYYMAFLNAENYRESCYTCKYASKNRNSDFTVGDFWGIEKINKEFMTKNGVSCVVISSTKGKNIFDNISKMFYFISVRYSDIYNNNGQLTHPPFRKNIRNKWYENFNDSKFIENIKIKFNIKSYIKLFVPSKYKIYLKSILERK